MATLGDIVAPRERGKYMSYMMVVMMLATIGGPLLGGFITSSFSWRWIFYINIPLGGTTRLTSALFYVVLGLGMGFLIQMVSLIAQNSVQQQDMGVASSAPMFFQQIGGSLGVAAFGAIFARQLTTSLATATGPGVHIGASGGQLDPARVNTLPAPVRYDVFLAIAHAVQYVFVWAAPSAVLILSRGPDLLPGSAGTAAPLATTSAFLPAMKPMAMWPMISDDPAPGRCRSFCQNARLDQFVS